MRPAFVSRLVVTKSTALRACPSDAGRQIAVNVASLPEAYYPDYICCQDVLRHKAVKLTEDDWYRIKSPRKIPQVNSVHHRLFFLSKRRTPVRAKSRSKFDGDDVSRAGTSLSQITYRYRSELG